VGDGIRRDHLPSEEGRWSRSNGVVEQWSYGRIECWKTITMKYWNDGKTRIQPFDIAQGRETGYRRQKLRNKKKD
jgi:hypothetical protein